MELLARSDYDFSSLQAGGYATVMICVAIRVEAGLAGTLLVRVHSATMPSGGSFRVFAQEVAPAPSSDPAQYFRGPVAAIVLGRDDVVAPTLLTGALDARGGNLALFVRAQQGPSGGTFQFTISAALAQKTGDAWTPADFTGGSMTLWLDQRELVETSGVYASWLDQSISAGGNDFNAISGSEPAGGSTINALPSPLFDGSADNMKGGGIANIITASAYHGFAVVRFDALSATNPTEPWKNHCIIGDAPDSYWAVSAWTAGVQLYQFSASAKFTTPLPVTVGVTHLVEWSFDGAALRCRVDNGPTEEVGAGAISSMAGLQNLGHPNTASTTFFHGAIAALLSFNARLGDTCTSAGRSRAAGVELFALVAGPGGGTRPGSPCGARDGTTPGG